jgi:predicted DNA-binding protein with PD1-like motif
MMTLPIRLSPGQDLRKAIELAVSAQGCEAAFVLSGIGSLAPAFIRFAGADQVQRIDGDVELLAMSGTVSRQGSHLHAALADPGGRVLGGHLGHGCIVRTTVELVLLLLREWTFSRKPDPLTGFNELAIEPRAPETGS